MDTMAVDRSPEFMDNRYIVKHVQLEDSPISQVCACATNVPKDSTRHHASRALPTVLIRTLVVVNVKVVLTDIIKVRMPKQIATSVLLENTTI